MSGGGGSQVVGYRYSFDIHMGIGRGPVDELVSIAVADRLAWQGSMTASGAGAIAAPELFGGDAKEGGIEGTFDLLMGEDTQVPTAGLAALQPPGVLTGFRRRVTLFYSGLVCSINPYPKKWSFRVRRAVQGWDGDVFRPDLAAITLDGDGGGATAADHFRLLDPPKVWPLSIVHSVSWSGDGRFLALAQGIQVDGMQVNAMLYKRNGRTLTFWRSLEMTAWTTDDNFTSAVAWSPDSKYLALAYADEPYIGMYRRDGEDFVNIAAGAFGTLPPGTVLSAAWSGDSTQFAMGRVVAPYVLIYRLVGGTFTKVADPAQLPTGNANGVALRSDGAFLAVAHDNAPFLSVYRREVDGTFTKLPDPATLPAGKARGVAWSPDGTHLAVAHDNAPFVTVYRQTGDIFEKRDDPATLPAGNAYAVSWRNDSAYLSVSHAGAPFLTLYKQSEHVLFKLADMAGMPDSLSRANAWSPDGQQLAVGQDAPYYVKTYGQGSSYSELTPNHEIRAMNPAHIIFECLTNREWGRGLDRSLLDHGAFGAAAEQLKAEGFGLCIKWSRRDSIETFVQSILDHIGATLYTNRSTALLTLTLIRGGYDRSALPLYDTTNGILEIRESTTSTSSGAINEVVVTYREAVLNEDKVVRVQNLASLQSSAGAFNSLAKAYPAIPTASLALRVAQRDLRTNAEGLRRFQVVMDRRAWKIAPGSVFRMRDTLRKVPDMVVRVARIEDGTLLDGRITLTVVQDVFSLPSSSFTGVEPDRWTPPNFNPCVGQHEVFEAPYFLLNRRMTRAEFDYLDESSAYLGVVAEKGQPMNSDYTLAVRNGPVEGGDWPTNDDAYCGYTPPTV